MRLLVCIAAVAAGCAGPDPADTAKPPVDTAALADTGPEPVPTTTWPPTTSPPYAMAGFSFIDDHVAGMPQPGRFVPLPVDLGFLVDQQIALLVSLTEVATDPAAVEAAGLDLLHLPIVDFTPPTLEQQVEMVDEIRARVAVDEKVGIHDTAGYGRCGTMLATWFVAKGMTGEEAITAIRTLRPGSIETEEQEMAIHTFAEHVASGE